LKMWADWKTSLELNLKKSQRTNHLIKDISKHIEGINRKY
jgi:hypothetical protein